MRIAALLLVAALLLAGCSSSPEPDTDTEDTDGPDVPADDGTDTGDDDTPPTTPPAPPVLTNAPPAAELTATAYEGTAPLDVTFLVDASDEDGDDLTFTLAFGDGSDNATGDVEGSASVNHTFEAEGTFTAVLAVFDGTAVTLANTTVVVTVGQAASEAETFYLHAGGSGPGTLDHIPASESEGAHGSIPLGPALVDWYAQTFTATEATLYPHLASSPVLVHIQGFTLTPDPTVTASVVLKAGDAEVGSGSSPATTSVSIGLVTTPCVDMVVPITPTADIPAGTILTIEVSVDSASVFAPCFPGGEEGPRAIFA